MKYQCLTLVNFPAWASFSAAPDIVCVPVIRRPQLSLQAACFPFTSFPYLPANAIIIPVVWSGCSRGSVFGSKLQRMPEVWAGPSPWSYHMDRTFWKSPSAGEIYESKIKNRSIRDVKAYPTIRICPPSDGGQNICTQSFITVPLRRSVPIVMTRCSEC